MKVEIPLDKLRKLCDEGEISYRAYEIMLNAIDKDDFDKMEHTYKPLPEGLYIGGSSIHGHGLFTELEFGADHNFGVSHMEQEVGPNYTTLLRTPLGGFINHSVTRDNCMLKKNPETGRYYLISTKPIAVDGEILLNYNNCPCNAPDF